VSEEHRPVADRGDRSLDDLADPEVAHVVHEVRSDAVLALPGELRFTRPVAAQPDLNVSACVDVAVADEPVHGAVGVLHAEDLGACVRVRAEVDETRSSVGAPITAMSTPASSAGSCVYGMPAYVSNPA
jgi:hypothetical protein